MERIATVKMYKGEEVCHECGRHIRNVVEIDGVTYGVRCCEKYLPRTHKVDHKRNVVVEVMSPVDYARSLFEDQEIFIRFWVKPLSELQAYLDRRPAGYFRCAGVIAIMRAKSPA